MASDDRVSGPEWSVLEACCDAFCRDVSGAAPPAIAPTIACPDFSWALLVEYTTFHKLGALLASCLLHPRLRPLLPRPVADQLEALWDANRHRVRVLGEQACRIAAAGSRHGVRLAVRKGIAFERMLYGARGIRTFRDIDFMVCPDQRDAAAALLRTLGFRIGRSDDHDASVAELDRTLLAVHALYPDHLPRFVGATTDPSVRYVEVDVACSLTWATSDYHVPLGAPFDALCEVGSPCADSALLTFPPAYQFLDAAMHLFREAFVGLPNGRGSASWATLSAFVDIRLLCRRYGAAMRASGLPEEVRRLGLGAPVAWVLAHTDRLFGTGHLAGLGLAAFADEDWIASWRPAGMACQRWHGDMRRRLRDGGELRWTPPG